jgi:hypothetical protein
MNRCEHRLRPLRGRECTLCVNALRATCCDPFGVMMPILAGLIPADSRHGELDAMNWVRPRRTVGRECTLCVNALRATCCDPFGVMMPILAGLIPAGSRHGELDAMNWVRPSRTVGRKCTLCVNALRATCCDPFGVRLGAAGLMTPKGSQHVEQGAREVGSTPEGSQPVLDVRSLDTHGPAFTLGSHGC